MPEFNAEPVVREAFAGYLRSLPETHPAGGIVEVRQIARHRRRVRAAVIAAVAALLIGVPAAGYGLSRSHTGQVPAHPVPSATSPVPHTPSTSPSAAAAPAPDGRIPIGELTQSVLSVPAWPAPANPRCASGTIQFHGSVTINETPLWIEKSLYEDVDGDGAQETVAILWCLSGKFGQVIAFDRDAAGKIVTLGQVVAARADGTGVIESVFDLRAEANGSIGVLVGDLSPCCGLDDNMVERQWRTYAWDGRAFGQVGGPTSFHPAPTVTKLVVTASDLRFGPLTGGVRTGTLKLTVRNDGPASAPGVVVEVGAWAFPALPAKVTIVGPPGCQDASSAGSTDGYLECHTPPLAVGASRTLTFQFTLPAADDPAVPTTARDLWPVGAQEEQPGIRRLGTLNHLFLRVSREG